MRVFGGRNGSIDAIVEIFLVLTNEPCNDMAACENFIGN